MLAGRLIRLSISTRIGCQLAASSATVSRMTRLRRPRPAPVIDEEIPDLVSVTEVATMYEIARQSVLGMITSGRLPARKAGGTWVIRREVAEGLTVDE